MHDAVKELVGKDVATLRFTKEEKYAVGMVLVVKLLVVSAILISFYVDSDFGVVPNLWNRWYTGPDDLSSWYIPFANWDGQYYLLLSDWGYNYQETPDSPRAFFPLYPTLIRILSYVIPRMVAAAVLSFLLTAGFCYFLFKLGDHFGCRKPHLVILITLAFPTAFFASVFYTEALFLFLQLGFVYHFLVTRSSKRWIYAALLPLTRGTAIFFAVGVLAYMLLEYFKSAKQKRQREVSKRRTRKGKYAYASATRRTARKGKSASASAPEEQSVTFNWNYYLSCYYAFLVGGMLYLAFFAVTTGDALAGVSGQATFGVNSISNLLNPGHFIAYISGESTSLFGARDSLSNKAFVVAAMLCILVFVFHKEWALLCFYLPLVYCQAAMGIGVSFPRFFFVAIPFLALTMAKNVKQPWLIYAICAAMLVFQLYLLHKFSLNLWIA